MSGGWADPVGPKAPLYPCYSAEAARVMCRFGLSGHEAIRHCVLYLLDNTHESGGWRCNITKFGLGPETEFPNPGATLFGLDVLRFFKEYLKGVDVVDRAIESLLCHWETRKPIGPCHYGIGTLFMQVEFPFLRYNLFYYLYVLSFYELARGDPRFEGALECLESKLSEKGEVIVERPHRGLKELDFCARGQPYTTATVRYREIRQNLERRNG